MLGHRFIRLRFAFKSPHLNLELKPREIAVLASEFLPCWILPFYLQSLTPSDVSVIVNEQERRISLCMKEFEIISNDFFNRKTCFGFGACLNLIQSRYSFPNYH